MSSVSSSRSQHSPAPGLPLQRHTIFQNSLMSALLDGIYDGEMTVSELLGHGNFGLGTFDALDGEMVIVDGQCYQIRGDGSASPADLNHKTPYSVATNFVPRIKAAAPPNLPRAELSAFIDSLLPSDNYMYALRIDGHFDSVTCRTVTKQSKPYRPMVQSVADDVTVTFRDVSGVVVGFRTPVYEKNISVPGCHVHFLDQSRSAGGHILDFRLREGTVSVCPGTDLQLRLPLTPDFSRAHLDPEDLDQQIHATEVKHS